MAQQYIENGDLSDEWRVVFVETRCEAGRYLHTDIWPFGITLKPGQDPKEIRNLVAPQLSWPEVTTPEGLHFEADITEPDGVYLYTTFNKQDSE